MEIAFSFLWLAMASTLIYICYKIEGKREQRYYERLEKALTNAMINSRIAK